MRFSRLVAALACASAAACSASHTLVAPPFAPCAENPPPPRPIRVASFNVRAGLESSLAQVGDTLARIDADVVALQEVDKGVDRTARVDQARALAERLGYQFVFAAAIHRGGGEYGIALLSRLPIASAERIQLEGAFSSEPRVAIDAQLCVGDRPLRVVATHVDFLPWAGTDHAAMIAQRVKRSVGSGVIVLGDLNQTQRDQGPRRLREIGLRDVLGEHHEGETFWPNHTRIDYLFADRPLGQRVRQAHIVEERTSDHYPIWADFDLSQR